MTRKEIEEAKVLTKFRVGTCIRLIKHPECRSVVLAIEDGFYKCDNDTIPIKDSYKWEMYAEIKEEADIIAMQERRWLIKPPSTRKEQIEQASLDFQNSPAEDDINTIADSFRCGAEWADEHPKDEYPKDEDFKDFVKSYMSANDDNILHYYDRYAGLVDGAQWQKEQMMKDAIEAELYLDGDFLTLDYDFVQLGMKRGDKVKVIII